MDKRLKREANKKKKFLTEKKREISRMKNEIVGGNAGAAESSSQKRPATSVNAGFQNQNQNDYLNQQLE